MTNTNIIAEFTQQFSDLVACSVPLRQAALDMSNIAGSSEKVRCLSAEVADGFEQGRNLSSVLASCMTAKFPQWYTAFVSAAEENGCMTETLLFLSKTLLARQKIIALFLQSLVYPLLVIGLCTACSLWAVVAFPRIFCTETNFASEAFSAFALSVLFLLAVVFLICLILKAVLSVNPCIALMNALAFLTNKGTSLSDSLEYVVPVVEEHERLCEAVLSIREKLLSGECAEFVFLEQLQRAGFAAAANMVASNLSLVQAGSERNVFEKTAEMLSQKAEKLRSAVLTYEQPVLLCCAAVYMLILVKNTLLPYIIQFGG